MSLRLIIGRAGSGKTTFCFKEIKEKLNNDEKIYIITPEQYSFTQEKNLLNTITENSSINAEVLTFDRMAHRVFNEVGGKNEICLSESSTAMLLYEILDKEKNNLTFLGKSSKNIDILSRIFTELKKHNINIEQLKQFVQNTENIYLRKKIEDIIILKESFEKNIPQGYIEGADRLTKLSEKLEQSTMFDNSIFYLDEFVGFTKQEYKIIEKLLKKAKQVNIAICADCLEEKDSIETDLFYSNKQTGIQLIEIAKESKIKIEKPVILDKIFRFKNDELLHLEKNIYRIEQEKYKDDTQNIELLLTINPYSEIENLAKKIIQLVRGENYRFKDIAVITKNINDYKAITKAIFAQYEIPIFIDEKEDLSKNVLVQFLLSIFDIYSKNWSYEAVFTYLKTGLTDLEYDKIHILENYCINWNIKGKKWYIDDWNYGNLDKEQLEEINGIRNQVVKPLLELKEKIYNQKTVKGITTEIYNFLINYGILEKLVKKSEEFIKLEKHEIANQYETTIKIIIQVFDEIVSIFGDKIISFDKYREILKIALENKNLGAIPGVQDEVVMGDVDRSRTQRVKAVFILGINDGIFPSKSKDEGFLDDNDRKILKKNNIELAKGSIEQLYDERFNIYKAFSTAEEKIFLSYTSTDKDGKAIRPSVLITNIKQIFPKLKLKSNIIEEENYISIDKPTFDDLLKNIYLKKQGKQIDKIWYDVFKMYENSEKWKNRLNEALKGIDYTNVPEKIEKEQIKKLYGDKLKTSISKLEQYRSCPFSFHLKYGLKLKEPVSSTVRPIDTGTFMHDVIDSFFSEIKESKININNITKDELEKIIVNIIDKKLAISTNYILTSSNKFRTLTRKLKKIIIKSITYIIEQLRNSNFQVFGTEIEFKNEGNYPPIVIDLEDNKKVEITGKIDRVDLAIGNDGKYIRIIDYKSSVKKIDLNEVMYGLQIQLITYLNEMTYQLEAEPTGILYFNLIDYMISTNKHLTEEELEKELKKNYKMQGLVVDDVKVVKMMDTRLENGYSENIPVYLGKTGVSSKLSSCISKEDFENLQKQSIKIIKQISKEILQGDISLKPFYNKNNKTPCEYCIYHSICNFNTRNKNNEYYYIPNLSKDEILGKLREGEKDVQ